MIDFAPRPSAVAMCDVYHPPAPTESAPLDGFQEFFGKKRSQWSLERSFVLQNDDPYLQSDYESPLSYHNLAVPKPFSARDKWRVNNGYVTDWTNEDTITWLVETAWNLGISQFDIPFYHFDIPGMVLKDMTPEQFETAMYMPSLNPETIRDNAEKIYNSLQEVLNKSSLSHSQSAPMLHMDYYSDGEPYQPESQTAILDLDNPEHNPEHKPLGAYQDYYDYQLSRHCESGDEIDDFYRPGASPEQSSSSEGGKSCDEGDDKRPFKRPPGRPKGSGKTLKKRVRNVSVPQFLRDLLFDSRFCPSIIKWENHGEGKFRFVKPDEVAKLWGKQKQNENMTFEKFSRAMRYHYKQSVLVSVPTARLVYQFGHKGPDFKTDNPNFTNVKHELDYHNEHLYS